MGAPMTEMDLINGVSALATTLAALAIGFTIGRQFEAAKFRKERDRHEQERDVFEIERAAARGLLADLNRGLNGHRNGTGESHRGRSAAGQAGAGQIRNAQPAVRRWH